MSHGGGGGGTPCSWLYGKVLPKRGALFTFHICKRVGKFDVLK